MQRATFILASAVLALPPAALAQGTPTLPFRFDRTSEDWSAMRDPANRTRPWHDLKWSPLGEGGHVTLGGEFKLRTETIDAPNFGATGLGQDTYAFQRLMLHADVRVNANLRAFVQLSHHEGSGRGSFFPLDDGGIDLHQGFAEIGLETGGTRLDVRAGRQELVFSPRLLASREGVNIRAAYDGVRAIAAHGPFRTEVWTAEPVENGDGNFDDSPDASQSFDGVRASYSFGE